jgi:hypothetical protein
VRFPDFLRAATLLFAGSASVLAFIAVVGTSRTTDVALAIFGAAWWLVTAAAGAWLGRRPQASAGIARLLAGARSSPALPELEPGTILFNRLWGLAAYTAVAGGLGFLLPQVPAIAAGYALLVALTWRRQPAAVAAIEGRDGVRFYVERTSPFKPTRLLRTPGFRHFEAAEEEPEPAADVRELRSRRKSASPRSRRGLQAARSRSCAAARQFGDRAAQPAAAAPRLRRASSSVQARVLATAAGPTHARRAVATA